MNQIEHEKADKSGDGTPVCVRCFKPVDPLAHYCSHCGEATGQFTHYIPFVNIPWQTRIWGQVWRQIWSRDVSLPGRAFRLFMVVWNVPVMLIGLLFKPRQEQKKIQHQNGKTKRKMVEIEMKFGHYTEYNKSSCRSCHSERTVRCPLGRAWCSEESLMLIHIPDPSLRSG